MRVFNVPRMLTCVPLSILVVVICVHAGCKRPAGPKNGTQFKITTTPVTDRVSLLTHYRCLDQECEDVDISFSKQTIAVGGREYEVTRDRDFVISRVLDTGSQVFAIVDNNHSTFLAEVCSEGRLDILAEASELESPAILSFGIDKSPPHLTVVIEYEAPGSSDPVEYRNELLMAGAFRPCGSL